MRSKANKANLMTHGQQLIEQNEFFSLVTILKYKNCSKEL